jgi:hypothetical protein
VVVVGLGTVVVVGLGTVVVVVVGLGTVVVVGLGTVVVKLEAGNVIVVSDPKIDVVIVVTSVVAKQSLLAESSLKAVGMAYSQVLWYQRQILL